jgi:hypothetical protein
LEEHGEREMRAIRLLREASAQILYLAHKYEESAVVAWFNIRQLLSKIGVFPGCLNAT